jgi:predicted ribosome quality control (RQC) complex YloA/Tae2 family protein
VKSPSFFEFQTIIQYLHEELIGSQLQEIISTEDGVVLGFYRFVHEPKAVWLVFDMDTQFPFVGLFHQNPWLKIKKTKPVALFLSSHFKNTHLKDVQVIENFGRVAEFDFSLPDKKLVLQLRLIPKQPNLIVSADDKSISWEKPRDLVVATIDENFESENRSIPFLFKQWFERRAKTKSKDSSTAVSQAAAQASQSPFDKWVQQRQKDLQKKQKALNQIDEQKNELLKVPWAAIGDHLKTNGFKDLPLEWTTFVDLSKKPSFSIEKAFEKAKQVVHKIQGADIRKTQVLAEIELAKDVSERRFQKHLSELAAKQVKQGQRKASEGNFRKLTIEGENPVNVLMGKNAVENLKLLRQAKAWDLWVHLKDYPSAYAILQKPKDKNVSDHVLVQAGQWLVKESIKNKKNMDGAKLSVVIVECRHVRPIKGDKLGRVTYHHPREMLITV